MGWFVLCYLFSTLISLVSIGRLSQQEKDLEILLLRHQLAILERKLHKPVKPNRAEKLTLAVLTARLRLVTRRSTSALCDVIRIVQPETVLKWHRELVRRKWLQKRKQKGGRPRISQELEDLIVQMAQENARWGYGKIEGELLKLGFSVRVHRAGCAQASSHRPCTGTEQQQLASSDEPLQGTAHRLRFFHSGDAHLEDTVRPLLHRTG